MQTTVSQTSHRIFPVGTFLTGTPKFFKPHLNSPQRERIKESQFLSFQINRPFNIALGKPLPNNPGIKDQNQSRIPELIQEFWEPLKFASPSGSTSPKKPC